MGGARVNADCYVELLTWKALKDSYIPRTLALCPTADTFRDYSNEAVETLMTRGNWLGTVQKIAVCVYNGCVTWPREVGTILAMNFCNGTVPVWNNWFSFMPLTKDVFNQPGGFGFQNACFRGMLNTEHTGYSPVFNPIKCGKNVYIRAYPSVLQDVGKTVTIFGTDENGQTIRSKVDGEWVEGITLTLATPFVSTAFKIRKIDRIRKDLTQSVVRYFQYDADLDLLYDLVTHNPSELNPTYRFTQIHGFLNSSSCSSDSCGGLKQIEAMVKLQYLPFQFDTDLIPISCKPALKKMIQSIKIANSENPGGAVAFETTAIHDLNLELHDKFPLDQIPIELAPFGRTSLRRYGIGMV